MNDYIGATGNFYINDYIDYTSNINFIYTSNSSNYLNKRIDDIDIETSNISSNISSIYSNNLRNELWDINPNNDLCLIKYKTYSGIPHNYVINSNVNGEIRFSVLNSYATNNEFPYNCSVKIDNIGKLMIYHNFIPIQPLFPQAWYDVEGELFALKNEVLVVINPAIASLGAFQTLAEQQIIVSQGLISVLQDEVISLQTSIATLEITTNHIAEPWEQIELIAESQTMDMLRSRFDNYSKFINLNYAATATTWLGVGFGFGIPLMLNSMADYMYRERYNNLVNNFSNAYIQSLTTEERRILYSCNDEAYQTSFNDFYSNSCNLGIYQGFINSNIITTQFIPSLKSNKIILGNITTPNIAYQMEMTGDLNLNMLYLNSTSLTSLLNQKQGNLTFTQPLYNTTNTIGINYDSSLTKIGNNLSVVKTATTPIVITGNNWTLNYDSTLELSGNNLKVASATASKWTTSGINIYNNNTGNVGINTTNPSYKLHIEDGSLFIGDSSVGNGSQTDNGYRLVFDSSYTATGANKCNKILLHKNDNAPTYVGGFGVEAQGLTYSAWTGGYHNFYTSATSTSGGFLSCSIYRDNFRFYGSTNGGAGGVISNGNAGSSAYSYLALANDTGNGILFLNSSTKITDGGANCLTLRNDVTGGDLRLSANSDTPYIFLKKSTGLIGIDTTAPAYKLHINGSLGCGAINSLSITTNNNAINAGTGSLTCGSISSGSITTNNNAINAGTATITATNFSGKITPTVNVWNTSSDGYNRFYFANTSRTYFSSGSGFEWRHSTDAGIAVMSTIGQLGLDNLSPIGLLSLGDSSKVGSDGSLVIHKNSGGGSQRHMKMGFYTSTYDLTIGDFGNNNLPGTWVKTFYITWNAPNTSLAVLSNGIVYTYYGFQSASDIKLKTDIKTIENALWKVEQLRGVEYNHIITQDKNIGLIAQEVEHIVPEVIGYNEETDTKTINYNGLVGLLIEAIKDLKAEINNLNKRIEILENK